MKNLLKFIIIILLFAQSCISKVERQDPVKAKELYSEGMDMLARRISLQDKDKASAFVLNEKVIGRFISAYNLDTTSSKTVFYISECTMFARDYRRCIFWTGKLMQLDTSYSNVMFCKDRIKYCELRKL